MVENQTHILLICYANHQPLVIKIGPLCFRIRFNRSLARAIVTLFLTAKRCGLKTRLKPQDRCVPSARSHRIRNESDPIDPLTTMMAALAELRRSTFTARRFCRGFPFFPLRGGGVRKKGRFPSRRDRASERNGRCALRSVSRRSRSGKLMARHLSQMNREVEKWQGCDGNMSETIRI